ncbi:MAG: acyltransferase family protein [Planctomycetes bacterium]|nr:acyltransferase family protein [Planctomycetota bacterium]
MPSQRLHHLDALRSFAMLLGIVLHASLAFMPFPWPIQDSQQNTSIYIIFAAIHGFRMPLFFLLSGFFTAMLWRKRGALFLAQHRVKRIVIPLIIGCFTIIPATNAAVQYALNTSAAAETTLPPEELKPLSHDDILGESDPDKLALWVEAAIRRNDEASLLLLFEQGADPNYIPETKITALHWAAGLGQLEMAELLLAHGADLNALDDHNSTALHWAALFGRPQLARLLIERGIDTSIKNKDNTRALEMVTAEARPIVAGIAKMLAGLLSIPFDVDAFHIAAAEIFEMDPQPSSPPPFSFHHLWFLWYLVLLTAAFFVLAPLLRLPKALVVTPLRYLWMIPLVALMQAQMDFSLIGPDTSAVLTPSLVILAYYAIFFFFGALYFLSGDAHKLGRYFWISLPLALCVILPIVLAHLEPGVERNDIVPWLSAGYTCLVSFGLIGLCRKILSANKKWVRYMSDASYWLYLAHLPLVFMLQSYVRDWHYNPFYKLIFICVVSTFILLASYQLLVRRTPIGWMLNGRLRNRND